MHRALNCSEKHTRKHRHSRFTTRTNRHIRTLVKTHKHAHTFTFSWFAHTPFQNHNPLVLFSSFCLFRFVGSLVFPRSKPSPRARSKSPAVYQLDCEYRMVVVTGPVSQHRALKYHSGACDKRYAPRKSCRDVSSRYGSTSRVHSRQKGCTVIESHRTHPNLPQASPATYTAAHFVVRASVRYVPTRESKSTLLLTCLEFAEVTFFRMRQTAAWLSVAN